jgi:hypothetical protein
MLIFVELNGFTVDATLRGCDLAVLCEIGSYSR